MATRSATPSPAALARVAEAGQFTRLHAMIVKVMQDGRESATVFALLGRIFAADDRQETYLRFLDRLLRTELPTLALVAAYLERAEHAGRLPAAERKVRARIADLPQRSWNSGDFLGTYPISRRSPVLAEYKYGEVADDTCSVLDVADTVADGCTLNTALLDRLYDSAGRPPGRSDWEHDLRRGFALDHAAQDKGVFRLDYHRDIRPLIDIDSFTAMAETVRQSGGALFLCCHAGQIALTRMLFTIETGWTSLQARGSADTAIAASKDLRGAMFTAFRHVQNGEPLLMAPDGPWGVRPIEIDVLGTRTHIGEGAAFIAYNASVRTIFLNMVRADDRLVPVIEEGPRRAADESYAAYKARWTAFYEMQVQRTFEAAAPSIAMRSRWIRPLSMDTQPPAEAPA